MARFIERVLIVSGVDCLFRRRSDPRKSCSLKTFAKADGRLDTTTRARWSPFNIPTTIKSPCQAIFCTVGLQDPSVKQHCSLGLRPGLALTAAEAREDLPHALIFKCGS